MLHEYKMKKYLTDQCLVLGIGLVIVVYFLYLFRVRLWFAWLLGTIILLPVVFVCRRLLVLPLDLLMGKKTEEVRFSARTDARELQFSREFYCYEWEFRNDRDHAFRLLIPEATKATSITQPKKDRRVRITYYRTARLLLSWEIIE